jgi:protein involved in ribonucleotide reduction
MGMKQNLAKTVKQQKERELLEKQQTFLDELTEFIEKNVDGLGSKSVPIPTLLGIPKQTLFSRREGNKALFTFTDLTVFYRNLWDKYAVESDERFKEVADWVLARIVIDFLAALGVKKSTIRGILDRDKTLLEMKSAQSVFVTISLESGSSEIITLANLKETLHLLLHPSSYIKQLHMTVFKEDMAEIVKIVQDWAYSENGNFKDQLDIQIYAREHLPIAETVGFFIDGEFNARLYNGEGFVEMSELGQDLLKSEINTLNDEIAVFQLPTSPEGRVIEWCYNICKNNEEAIPEKVFDFLRQKVSIFENQTNYISRSDKKWGEFFNFSIKEVQEKYGVDLQLVFEFIGFKFRIFY